MPQRILVAMSGGVDSAVAALLLKRAGADVAGAYMKNWINEDAIAGDCPWQQDITEARAAAAAIGIEFHVVNLMRDYRERVVHYLLDGYRAGTTPNPDVMCNREIKFGVFREHARRRGFDAIATGHYVLRRDGAATGAPAWFEGADPNKDQSYFLAMVRREDLATAQFPLGHLRKDEVRRLAREAGLPNAARKDSQGICFIGQVRMSDFLRAYVPDRPGDIVRATDGAVLGRHRGLHFYTLGQRRGIGIPSNTDHENYVVVGRDVERNELLVAFESPRAPGLWTSEVIVRDLNPLGAALDAAQKLSVRVRYRDPAVPAQFEPLGRGRASVRFTTPQRALAIGQVIALYRESQLLGGGYYESVVPTVALPSVRGAATPAPS